MFILKPVPRLHFQSENNNSLFKFNTFSDSFLQYVKNVLPSLYLGFNESLKRVTMKNKVISSIVHELEPKKMALWRRVDKT